MSEPSPIRIAAVGDVSLGRDVAPALASPGPAALLEGVRAVLDSADLRFANLECAITDSTDGRPGKPVLLRAPRSALAFVENARFDVVSIANNHILDFHERGLLDTVGALDDAGIPHIGAGADLAAASAAVTLEARGARVAFLGAFGSQGATRTNPGVLPLKIELIRPLVEAARRDADYVVLSAHWGMEFDPRVMRFHRDLAREIADLGVDLILGHGAHVFQGVERHGRCLIFYGLGNFLFDHEETITHHGAVALVTLSPGAEPAYELAPFRVGKQLRLTPTDDAPPHAGLLTGSGEGDDESDRDFLKAVIWSKLRKGPIQGPLAVLRGLRHAPTSYYRILVRAVTSRFSRKQKET